MLESDHGLSYADFLTWMERLAIEAFKEEPHGLDTDLERVQHLLVYIDISPVLADLRLTSGTMHKATFSMTQRCHISVSNSTSNKADGGSNGPVAEVLEATQWPEECVRSTGGTYRVVAGCCASPCTAERCFL